MPRWIAIVVKIIAYLWAVAITLFLLYIGTGFLLFVFPDFSMPLVFVGFCCFAWSTWNDHATIRHLRKQLKIYEENVSYKEKTRWSMPKWAAIIVKIIACVWATAMTLVILYLWTYSIHGGGAEFGIALGNLVGFSCFALSAWINYSTTAKRQNQNITHTKRRAIIILRATVYVNILCLPKYLYQIAI